MFRYQTPLREMQFVLRELLGASATIAAMNRSICWDRDTTDQAIEAVGRFAEDELVRLNASGDVEGCRIEGGIGLLACSGACHICLVVRASGRISDATTG